MENPYNLISELLEGLENRRTRDVVARRFGLADGQPKTLQEIGDQYNITRERVRQIEENGLGYLSQPKLQEKLKPVAEEVYSYLKDNGELRREAKLYDDLVCFCFPASQLEQMRQKADPAPDRCRAALGLILTLGQPFSRFSETEYFHPFWTINKEAVKKAKRVVDSTTRFLDKNKQVLKDKEISQVIKKAIPTLSEQAIFSYLDIAKAIEQNWFGDFGLVGWPEISPRGVKDKAYLVFKKENRPLHFSEITDLINQLLPSSRSAYVQTVHNELIKDQRFVLIGRGIYALAEWGYRPGTVVEVISQVLRDNGPLGKEDILKNVLAKRLIKENTVLINLQNKNYFKKLGDGRFVLV